MRHRFRNQLVLNQWLIDLLGVDSLQDYRLNGRTVRPFHVLAEPIRDARMEGLDEGNIHRFFTNLVNSQMFPQSRIGKLQLLCYEENIVRHTQRINEKRHRPITWKYPQWLTLLFTEIYLDRYFSDRAGLLQRLNEYVDRFNQKWPDYAPVPAYTEDDLNKLCFQNATGSGKTLIMHINLLQYQHYAKQAGRLNDLSRVILLTPNERLTDQHLGEFAESNIAAARYAPGTLYSSAVSGLGRVDVLEITKLADQDGPTTFATRSFGDQNLLLVDEGHRGMSAGRTAKKEEGAWFRRRNALCEKGFTFEYSATFAEAVAAADDEDIQNAYAKAVLFDYSYRYFYEDGFGKDYQIINLSKSFEQTQAMYLTACLLKFYQQLRIYEERRVEYLPFNLEKPLWVFVGSSVVKATGTEDEKAVASDVAKILRFVAEFLHRPADAIRYIELILTGTGQDTGLLDEDGTDIFAGSFIYLARAMNAGNETPELVYQDILRRVFNNAAGGTLVLSRVKGDSGEIALKVGAAEEPFGLINVGDALGLCNHCQQVRPPMPIEVVDSEFTQAMFAGVKDSDSPVNLLIGSKKFVEGWDCWRVSTMGLMHVGKSEGSQIIQLFGRGVRLKGYQWSLKRSGKSLAPTHPQFIEELETLNVFGIEADFMERFRRFLREEGLPGNERPKSFPIPLAVTYDFGKKLKILRPKQKASDGREYDFKRDGRVPSIGDVPDYLKHNTVVADWYPRIQAVASRGSTEVRAKIPGKLETHHLAMLDYDALYFEVERFKRERTWYNLNVPRDAIEPLLADSSWYTLYIPPTRLEPSSWDNVRLWQDVATELLKRYCDHYYNYCKSAFYEPRLEYRELKRGEDPMPEQDASGTPLPYQLIVDESEDQVIQAIKEIQKELAEKKKDLFQKGDLYACVFGSHLYQPLFHVRRGGKIQVLPVALNESEYQFVQDLKKYSEDHKDDFKAGKRELFLLRNMSRGRGVGFFEARNFHPDFIMWVLEGGKQYVTFIEPHGLHHEGPASQKVLFSERVKEIERRLGDPSVVLNSFILSWTKHGQLDWGLTREQFAAKHVFFMTEDKATYIGKMLAMIVGG